MGDRFNMSGDFRGAIVNIKSTLTQVQQSVGEIKSANPDDLQALEDLIGQLSEALQGAPPENQEQVEAVAQTAQALVETAKAETPNQTILQITADGLKKAAQNLAEVMPAVTTIAGQIVMMVMKLSAGG